MKAWKIATLLLIIGLIGSTAISLVFSQDIKEFYYSDEVVLTYSVLEVNEINIDVTNRNIVIDKSSDANIYVRYYVEKSEKANVTTESNKLSLSIKPTWQTWFGNFSTRLDQLFEDNYISVRVFLPQSLDNISAITKNGNITVGNVSIDDGILKTLNGDIVINKTTSNNKLEVQTSNGRVNISESTFNNVSLKTSNGRITFKENEFQSAVARTSNGRIDVDLFGILDDYQITVKTSNGTIKIGDLKYDNQVINLGKSKKIDLKTSNGGININFK